MKKPPANWLLACHHPRKFAQEDSVPSYALEFHGQGAGRWLLNHLATEAWARSRRDLRLGIGIYEVAVARHTR